jgi:peroxiredoxin
MKNTFTFFIILLILFSGVRAQNTYSSEDSFKFRLHGQLTNGENRKVYLTEFAFWKSRLIRDTTYTDANGRFEFRESMDEPSQFFLSVEGSSDEIDLVISDSAVGLFADAKDLSYSAVVSGSREVEVQAAFKAIKADENAIYAGMESRRNELKRAQDSRDSLKILQLQKEGFDAETRLLDMRKNIIIRYPNALTSIMQIRMIQSPSRDQTMPDSVLKVIETSLLGDHALVKYYRNKVDALNRTSVGKQAPDFSLPDLRGKTISLASLKGKYVYIDFWASWCGPCREENVHLVDVYKRFGGKQFAILSVSMDQDLQKWKDAVIKDKLTWLNVCEVKALESEVALLYSVTSLPESILIDPEGRIVGRNLRGMYLEKKLEELLSTVKGKK